MEIGNIFIEVRYDTCSMDDFTLSEGGILRPMTPEEQKFGRDSLQAAPVVATDLFSSISQIISPRRKKEIIGLAEMITEDFEEHVDTRIRNSAEIRSYRDADEFPVRQLHITVELAYAYQLLHLFNPEIYGQRYAEESHRLRIEVAEKTDNFAKMPTLGFTAMLRLATLLYVHAALQHLELEEKKVCVDEQIEQDFRGEVEEALTIYQATINIAARYRLDDAEHDAISERLKQTRSIEDAIRLFGDGANLFNAPGEGFERETAIEHYRWLMQDMYVQHTEDILFGMMRCYALLGDYGKLIETADMLEAFQTSEGYKPSRLIRESAEIIRQQALTNQAAGNSVPFVADSLEEHAKYARSLVLNREVMQPRTAEQELGWVEDNS